MSGRTLKRVGCVAAVVVVVVLACVGWVASASAAVGCVGSCRPWLRLSAQAFPGSLPRGGEGEIALLVENFGDVGARGSSPLVVSDRLPEGVSAQSVEIPGQRREARNLLQRCAGEVKCSLPGEVAEAFLSEPFASLEVEIAVKVAAGAGSSVVNAASVSGAGSPGVSVETPIAVGSGPVPFGVESYELWPENADGSADTQAGSHPFQLTTSIELNQTTEFGRPPASVKDLRFNLPPGLIGNPTPFPQCPLNKFLARHVGAEVYNDCPDDTVVGVASVTIFLVPTLGGGKKGPAQTFTVPLFALVPSVGEPARFGFEVVGDPVYLDTSVRTGGDYGVTVTVPNITEVIGFVSSRVTFWGVPGDPRHDSRRGWNCVLGEGENGLPLCAATEAHSPPPLLTMPTSCTGPVRTSVEADSWQQEGAFLPPVEYTFKDNLGRPVGMDGCSLEPFTPSIKVTPDGQAGSTATGLTVDEHVPQETSLNPAGLAESDVKGLSVTLPEGVAINPAGADGLMACSTEAIALQSGAAGACPEAAKLATVKIKTPLLPNPLEGAAYLATQNTNPFGSAGRAVCRSVRSGVGDPCEGDRGSVGEPGDGPVDDALRRRPDVPAGSAVGERPGSGLSAGDPV